MALRTPIAVLLGGGVLAAAAAGCGTNDNADLVAGKRAFTEKCGACHTLSRAGTKGIQGPNLDEAFRQAVSSGMGRDAIRAVVANQIEHPAQLPKGSKVQMPADLVTGRTVHDVAAYVAASVARSGEDTGLLAEAVKKPGGGKPAVEQNGTLTIPATAQLAYETDTAEAKPGPVTIKSPNPSGTPHDIAIEGNGLAETHGEVVTDGAVSQVEVTLKPGKYTFFCTVPGHREGGMEGTLTVK